MRFSYQTETFNKARRLLMLPHPKGETRSIASALSECMHGIHELQKDELDDGARQNLLKLEAFMDTSGVEDVSGVGTYMVKAEQMSEGEAFELSRVIDELASWFEREFWTSNSH